MDEQTQYWQKFDETFFNDGYRLCNAFIGQDFSIKNIFAAQKQLYVVVDQLIDSFIGRSRTEGNPPECRKGCAFCCHQTVLASTYELLYLADFLKKKYPGKLVESVIKKLEAKADLTRGIKMDSLLKFKMPCPLLHPTGGYCTSYQARPVACRIYLSSSEASCRLDLEQPENDNLFPSLYEMPLRAGRMLNEGFQARLREGRIDKLQVFETTIEQGVLSAFKPEAAQKWLTGKKVFKQLV